MKIPWGKHVNKDTTDVPLSYLAWMIESADLSRNYTLKKEVVSEIKIRMELIFPSIDNQKKQQPEIISVVRKLCLACHPDHGGSVNAMKIVNELRELVDSQ